MQIIIRQSGGANIVSLPKAILKTLQLEAGSPLDISIEDNKIILTPSQKEITLEELLEGSPKSRLKLTEEDREWESEQPKGKEF